MRSAQFTMTQVAEIPGARLSNLQRPNLIYLSEPIEIRVAPDLVHIANNPRLISTFNSPAEAARREDIYPKPRGIPRPQQQHRR
jgi:hypothetical protein